MKSRREGRQARKLRASALGLVLAAFAVPVASSHAESPSPKTAEAIPWSQIGAKAGADYEGDGLSVIPTGNGARLRCIFQRLEAEATPEGLWLTSTVTNSGVERFRVVAADVRRLTSTLNPQPSTLNHPLPRIGTVSVAGQTVRFTRPGLLEEYTVSMDGVRQDFVITKRPAGDGELQVILDVTGARVEATAYGAQLVLENSGRKIAYSRLRVTDASGRELPARIEVPSVAAAPQSTADSNREDGGALPSRRYGQMLAVVVNDADAAYPVRIDPTFSDANWISMGGVNGTDNDVRSAVVDSLGNLYIGGSFTVVGDVVANGVAKWNGTNWSPLGLGLNGFVNTMALSGTELYVGGGFFMATNSNGVAVPIKHIAKWNGNGWSALGSGMNDQVLALAVSTNGVYAGGVFTAAGGAAANYIAVWNGTNWSGLGLGCNSFVFALALSGNNVYAGGGFTVAGGNPMNYVARWSGSNWSSLGTGVSGGSVRALAVSGGDLFAGGAFSTAGGVSARFVAKWNGNSWSALGSEINSFVYALAVSGNSLYAGGYFSEMSGGAGNAIAKWDGVGWTALGAGFSGSSRHVNALAVSSNVVYAGGRFAKAGGNVANRIAKWDGNSWSAVASGTSAEVLALAVRGSDLYVGGSFVAIGGINANYVAKWNGHDWTALGSGMDNSVQALAVEENNTLYAGGRFTNAGGNLVNYVAKWNGSNWEALGAGTGGSDPDPYVNALAVSGSDVYVGGNFLRTTNSGGLAVWANRLAKWNGSSWSALGSVPSRQVFALAMSGTNLFAGGRFVAADGYESVGVARWDGSSWSAWGSEMNGAAWALAVDENGNLYAGGSFTTVGGKVADYIARWNGSSWSSLGVGMNDWVQALAVSGTDVYAGGRFTMAGGSEANYIAKWNGSSWSALGSGLNNRIFALANSEGDLVAGGFFTTAGGKASAYLARAIINEGKLLSLQPDAPGTLTNTLTFAGIPTNSYPVQFATNLTTSPWFTFATNTANANGRGTVLDPAATNDQRFYRVLTP